MELPPDFLLYVVIGFAAQLIDGALGMAYGVTALARAGVDISAASTEH